MASKSRYELLGIDRLTAKYNRLAERFVSSEKSRVFFLKAMSIMSGSINKNFKQQGRPSAWQPLKPATIARRRMGGKGAKILLDTGRLRASATRFHEGAPNTTTKIERQFAVFGSTLEYAATHHFGDPKRNIPARPFMFFQKQDVVDINRTLLADVKIFDEQNRIRAK